MTNLKKKLSALLLVLCFVGNASWSSTYDQNGLLGLKYGPNLSWALAGNTPFVWGSWLPQATGELSFNWIEPLSNLPYGKSLERGASFLRFNADVEVSPFYGGFSMGLGIRPLQINPQVEFRFIYENYTYFGSNVEMTLVDSSGTGNIADTWTADYVTNSLYDDSRVDYMQNFTFCLDLDYNFGLNGLLGLGLHYTLVDISTEYEGKSYDYSRNIPVFSRDFIFELILYGFFPINKNWALSLYLNQYNTGYLRSSTGTYLKESLSYTKIMLGPSFSWNKGNDRITLMPGYWVRGKKRHYNGSEAEQFLIHLQYQGYFDFPVKSHSEKW